MSQNLHMQYERRKEAILGRGSMGHQNIPDDIKASQSPSIYDNPATYDALPGQRLYSDGNAKGRTNRPPPGFQPLVEVQNRKPTAQLSWPSTSSTQEKLLKRSETTNKTTPELNMKKFRNSPLISPHQGFQPTLHPQHSIHHQSSPRHHHAARQGMTGLVKPEYYSSCNEEKIEPKLYTTTTPGWSPNLPFTMPRVRRKCCRCGSNDETVKVRPDISHYCDGCWNVFNPISPLVSHDPPFYGPFEPSA
ncbi:uncharacterized protein [Watersipora subatra]|uniref:uncharacterized protein isoform X2 n=1 Tax=Watersipora subatra TaxID=2589382 RepID=UPI00355ACE25